MICEVVECQLFAIVQPSSTLQHASQSVIGHVYAPHCDYTSRQYNYTLTGYLYMLPSND